MMKVFARCILMSMILVSCSERRPTPLSEESLHLSDDFHRTACTDSSRSATFAEAGAVFSGEIVNNNDDVTKVTHTVVSIVNEIYDVETELRISGADRAASRRSKNHIGMFAVSGGGKVFSYSLNPAQLVRELEPEDRRTFTVAQEASSEGDESRRIVTYSVEMLGCGELHIYSRREPVRALKIQFEYIRSNGELEIVESISYLSDRYGWPIRRDYSGGSVEETLPIDIQAATAAR